MTPSSYQSLHLAVVIPTEKTYDIIDAVKVEFNNLCDLTFDVASNSGTIGSLEKMADLHCPRSG